MLNRPIISFLIGVNTLALLLFSSSSIAQIQFSDTSKEAGFRYIGPTYGASWGDINGDGWPDLFTNNHATKNHIYQNNTDGTFNQVTSFVDATGFFSTYSKQDTHGGTWADFDNDGDDDLLVTTGICCDPQFFLNENGILHYRSKEFGFGNDIDKGGRLPLWFDYDDDGLLDVALMTFYATPVMKQELLQFTNVRNNVGFFCSKNHYGQLTDVNNDGRLDVICARDGEFPQRVYDTSSIPFLDITDLLPKTSSVSDSIIADFNGDLKTDILLLRGALRTSEASSDVEGKLEAQLINGNKGFSFLTDGLTDFKLDWNRTAATHENIRIGVNGWSPSAENFVLDPNDPNVWGLKPYEISTEPEIYIGYEPDTQRWTTQLFSGGKWTYSYFEVGSTTAISDVRANNLWSKDKPMAPIFLFNGAEGFTDSTIGSGLNRLLSCVSGAAGDFDNDMDIDVYLVCRGGVQNIVNQLYENQGDGTFVMVPDAGGAPGSIGAAVGERAGTGDSVVIADYDVDGFLDLFITNGLNMRPYYRNGGPDQLYRNQGNTNQWIELDLVGTTSNRDAIGAKVYVTAGETTQLREQNGGIHRWSQSHKRIHFGLAEHSLVDIRVEWPSGVIDTFTDISSGYLYRVTEGGGIEQVILQQNFGPKPGDECGAPSYDRNSDSGVFIWKNCRTNEWHVRVLSDHGYRAITYVGRVTSDLPFANVAPFALEESDGFDISDVSQINYQLKVYGSTQDGFDFTLAESAFGCLVVEQPLEARIVLGSRRLEIPSAFDLNTLTACSAP